MSNQIELNRIKFQILDDKLIISSEKSIKRIKLKFNTFMLVYLLLILTSILIIFDPLGLLIFSLNFLEFDFFILSVLVAVGIMGVPLFVREWYFSFIEGTFSSKLKPIEIKIIKFGKLINLIDPNYTSPHFKITYKSNTEPSLLTGADEYPNFPTWKIYYKYNDDNVLFADFLAFPRKVETNYVKRKKVLTRKIIQVVDFLKQFPHKMDNDAEIAYNKLIKEHSIENKKGKI